MSQLYQSLSHSRWNCKYPVMFVPKKECRIIEGHVMPDHIHMCIEVPPKHAVASVIGLLKGKGAIAIARQFGSRDRNFSSEPGLVAMRSRRLALSWSKSKPISVTKTAPMIKAGFRPID